MRSPIIRFHLVDSWGNSVERIEGTAFMDIQSVARMVTQRSVLTGSASAARSGLAHEEREVLERMDRPSGGGGGSSVNIGRTLAVAGVVIAVLYLCMIGLGIFYGLARTLP